MHMRQELWHQAVSSTLDLFGVVFDRVSQYNSNSPQICLKLMIFLPQTIWC